MTRQEVGKMIIDILGGLCMVAVGIWTIYDVTHPKAGA